MKIWMILIINAEIIKLNEGEMNRYELNNQRQIEFEYFVKDSIQDSFLTQYFYFITLNICISESEYNPLNIHMYNNNIKITNIINDTGTTIIGFVVENQSTINFEIINSEQDISTIFSIGISMHGIILFSYLAPLIFLNMMHSFSYHDVDATSVILSTQQTSTFDGYAIFLIQRLKIKTNWNTICYLEGLVNEFNRNSATLGEIISDTMAIEAYITELNPGTEYIIYLMKYDDKGIGEIWKYTEFTTLKGKFISIYL